MTATEAGGEESEGVYADSEPVGRDAHEDRMGQPRNPHDDGSLSPDKDVDEIDHAE